MDRLRVVERNLLPLVLAAAVLGVVAPGLGVGLSAVVTPLLAVLILCVSLSFDLVTLRTVLRRPGVQALATVLVYGPMSAVAYVLGTLVLGTGNLGMGVILVGVLPTDVSSPLLVLLARGNVALATVLNAVNTALAPLLVPLLFLAYTGVQLDVPTAALIGELAATVLLPTVIGVLVRTRAPLVVARLDAVWSTTGSLAYLALLLAVVGPNAATISARPGAVALVAAVALALNVSGYAIGALARPLLPAADDRTALLFTVSKKEFSIAAVVVATAGLPEEVALPAAVYAVVQMLTSPLVARRLARRG
jgi:BASS family bile acid:Na+ symporter